LQQSSKQSGAYVYIACDGFFAAFHFLSPASFADSLSIIIIIITFWQFLFFQAAFSTTTIGSTRQQGASEVR
jgi:hypothetical protein